MRQKTKFVLVNHSILDFEVYRDDFYKFIAGLKPELCELATKYGFELVKISKHSELRRKAIFYNKQFDMQLTVIANKRSPPEFV